jgi:hypothetical protein
VTGYVIAAVAVAAVGAYIKRGVLPVLIAYQIGKAAERGRHRWQAGR